MTCQNPECYCHQTPEFQARPFISGKDRDAAFRSAISKLRNARDEIDRMISEGQIPEPTGSATLHGVQMAIYELEEEHKQAAERFGFTRKAAIGVGDWKDPE